MRKGSSMDESEIERVGVCVCLHVLLALVSEGIENGLGEGGMSKCS